MERNVRKFMSTIVQQAKHFSPACFAEFLSKIPRRSHLHLAQVQVSAG